MKYVSLVLVIAFIAFTFWFTKKTENLTIDQMNKMNNLIQQYMTQAVQNNQPSATEIEFSAINTDVIEAGRKMKANFAFSYQELNQDGELEKVYRKGTFLITSEDGEKWTAQIEKAGDVKVEFMAPFNITDQGIEPIENNDSEGMSNKAAPESEEAETQDSSDSEENS